MLYYPDLNHQYLVLGYQMPISTLHKLINETESDECLFKQHVF